MSSAAFSTTPRLFVETPLAAGATIDLPAPAAHYLVQVMRRAPGDPVRLFDNRTGEWLARMAEVGKKRATVTIEEQLSEREAVPDLWLCAAPIRKGRIDWVAEKACELGVRRLIPVLTRRTVVDRLNTDRLRAHMVEAAEQCERTALPELDDLTPLDRLLESWPADRVLIFADEEGGAPLADALPGGAEKAAILIGPEGGFDPAERSRILAVPQAVRVSLGPRILRADTAAIAAVSLWMAVHGDWFTPTSRDD
jgi:16S rRNA (uracil1498-N3)-methyltransferase